MKICDVCQGEGFYLTCISCHQEAPVYCYPGGCEKLQPCWKCNGDGYIEDLEENDEEVGL